MRKSFFDENNLADIDDHDLTGLLDQIMNFRGGDGIASRLDRPEPDVDLHNMVFMLTPVELLGAVNIVIESNAFKLKKNTFTQYLELTLPYGLVLIESGTPQFAWDSNAATEDLVISLVLNDIVFNDSKAVNRFNFDYPTLQIFTNDRGSISIRSYQTLKGGRTVENLLWCFLHFLHDADRLYRDITIFNTK